MKKKFIRVQLILFPAFIGAFFILNLAMPDREFSERENRYLKQRPAFSLSSLFSGKFTSDFESYATDQFAFRDAWTTFKARIETLAGKAENNDVYLCEGGRLIERFELGDENQLELNIRAVRDFAGARDIPVYFALIPGAAEIWREHLPKNAPSDSQLEIIGRAYEGFPGVTADIYGALFDKRDEYLYYRTDHHWTSLGAYYGYESLMSAMGREAKAQGDFPRRAVSDSFYGTLYSSSGFSWVAPDRIETFVEPGGGVKVFNHSSGESQEGKVYDMSFLEKKDKYSMFMGGNTPLAVVETGAQDAPSLLVIRDSYMDSLTPFLLENFSELHILDLRYYLQSLDEYIRDSGVDEILICMSVSNFASERNMFLLNR